MSRHRSLVRRQVTLALGAVLLTAQTRVPPTVLPPDPATDLVRVRAFLTTTSQAVDLTLSGAEWANVVAADPAFRAIVDGQTVHITRLTTGEVDIQLDMILASVRSRSAITWGVTPIAPGSSTLEVFNLNGSTPRMVDRFEAGASPGRFTTNAELLRAGGPLEPLKTSSPHLVVAFFYPWYSLVTWATDPRISDTPVPEYSTDSPDDLRRMMTTAKGAGIDAFVMSWSGRDFGGGIDHLRMLRCLDAASASGFKMAALLEMVVANPQLANGTADPETVLAWLTSVVDDYASQPGYLKVGGRPVVMAYAAQRLAQAGWVDVLRRLRASGRDVLLIGEGINNTRLGAFDGQFYYPSNDQPADSIQTFDRGQSLNVRTYHLLPADRVGRRVWVATVSPGYDDTHVNDGRTPRVTGRENGAYYARQWRAAFDNRADWIAITSWNEYFENTEIEATRLYGDLYLRLTTSWIAWFRLLHPTAVPRASSAESTGDRSDRRRVVAGVWRR